MTDETAATEEATTQATTEEATEPTEAETEAPPTVEETQSPTQETEPEKAERKTFSGVWFGLFLITGTLSLLLIGALVFRRRPY